MGFEPTSPVKGQRFSRPPAFRSTTPIEACARHDARHSPKLEFREGAGQSLDLEELEQLLECEARLGSGLVDADDANADRPCIFFLSPGLVSRSPGGGSRSGSTGATPRRSVR